MTEKFYITHAIAYPNGKPHIGHAYEAIAADAIARFHRLDGKDVRLVSGTDEHGLKMVQTARGLGRDTLEFASEMSAHFTHMAKELNVEYDAFVRTTSAQHKAAAQELWRRMQASGDLYLDRYEGWYSVRDEAFYGEGELTTNAAGVKLSPQGTPVEWMVEESWFFKLSNYQERLLKLYAEQPEFIQPDNRRNEVMRFVEAGLRDLSVSRTSFDWGVAVPDAGVAGADSPNHVMPGPDGPNHVMYVWVDALAAYLSGIGFLDEEGGFSHFWPADLHLIGKDIVRFHAVYWPAFLMSAGMPLPRQVFGHGFLLARDGEKMSKSAGNVVDPMELAATYGVDALRYFLLRDVRFGQDGSFSAQAIVERCNAELANSFGNLAQRVLSFIAKNLDGELPMANPPTSPAFNAQICTRLKDTALEALAAMNFSEGLEIWMQACYALNQYVDAEAPWALRKTDINKMQAVLAELVQGIRHLALVIQPIIPESAAKLLDQLGIPADERSFKAIDDATWYERLRASGHRIAPPSPIFPRLDIKALELKADAA
jgi:methionyl-tRNA synthetase